MEASSKPYAHPINLIAFFFNKRKKGKRKKKEKEKKGQKKKKKGRKTHKPCCLSPSPTTRKASLGVQYHTDVVAI